MLENQGSSGVRLVRAPAPNGELILSDPAYHYGTGVHWIRRELQTGTCRVLVKVSSREREAGFRIGVQKAETDIETTPSSPLYKELFNEIEEKEHNPQIALLAGATGVETHNREALFWLS